MGVEGASPAAGEEIEKIGVGEVAAVQASVASGTFSLPVELPEGEVQLDFARPGGGAELSIYAIPVALSQGLWTTGEIIFALLVFWLLARRWSRVQRQGGIPPRRLLGYFLGAVILFVIVGSIGLICLIGIFIVLELIIRPTRRIAT